MDAVEFLEELTRMCKMYTKEEPFESCNPCEKTCPLYELEFNSMNKDESNTGIFYLMKNESDTLAISLNDGALNTREKPVWMISRGSIQKQKLLNLEHLKFVLLCLDTANIV